MNIIDKIVIFHPQLRIWGGKKKLTNEEVGAHHLPKELVSLGNKMIVPRSALNPFESFKKRLHRMMLRYGVRLIGGYAVAEDNVQLLKEKLAEFETEFNQLKADFIGDYQKYVDQLVTNFPDWEQNLRTSAEEVYPTLPGKFDFNYKAYKLVPPGSEGSEDAEDDINSRFPSDAEFVDQAAKEIADQADQLLARFSAQEELKQVSLNAIRVIREKLVNLSVLDRKLFGGATHLVNVVLDQMPEKGSINGKERQMLTALLLFLRNMNEQQHQENLANGDYDEPDALIKAMGCNSPEEEETVQERPRKASAGPRRLF